MKRGIYSELTTSKFWSRCARAMYISVQKILIEISFREALDL
jgi:hypothetical protein